MRFRLALTTAVVGSLAMLAACSNNNDNNPTPTPSGSPTPTPTPSASPTPTPTPTPGTTAFTSPSTGASFSGTIADPDGDGVSNFNIDGDETINASIGGATRTYSPTGTANAFSIATETYTSAAGASRALPVKIWAEGVGSSTGTTFRFYTVEKGAQPAGQTSNGNPITGAYLIESRGNTTGHGYGVIGDPTVSTQIPTTGVQTYTGEAIGFVSDSRSGSPAAFPSAIFVGRVTVTVDYTKTTSAVTVSIAVSQFIPTGADLPSIFTINGVADSLGGGTSSGSSFTIAGLTTADIPAMFRGQIYGTDASRVGGVFSATANGITVSGSLLTQR